MRSMALRDMQILKSEKKKFLAPPPKSWGRPWVFCNAFKSSFCINMAPTFLISGDGHGFMNRYHTLTIKEIHKLPKLVMIVFKKCANAGHVQWRSEGNWRPGANLNFAPPPLKKTPKKLY